MQAFVAALVGGLLTIAGGLAAVLATSRGVRSQWRKDTQLKVGSTVLSALQNRLRRVNELAYLANKDGSEAKRAWNAQVASTTDWNSARHAALLVSSPEVVSLLQDIDEQLDLLLVQAMGKQWTIAAFRKERANVGSLAGKYVDAARTETGSPPLKLHSLWMWERTEELPNAVSSRAIQTVGHQSGNRAGNSNSNNHGHASA